VEGAPNGAPNCVGTSMSGASIQQIRTRYLDLLERSVLNTIYGESPLETRVLGILQRLRHPYLTRRGQFPGRPAPIP
jgi:hypothetical protein